MKVRKNLLDVKMEKGKIKEQKDVKNILKQILNGKDVQMVQDVNHQKLVNVLKQKNVQLL